MKEEQVKNYTTSWDYIKENFEKDDRLAIVMVNKEKNNTVQKFATAEKIANVDYQKYLRYMNANGYNIYVSMNPIKDGGTGRTKDDIKEVRHIYLDIDENGKKVLDEINKDVKEGKLPQPNYVLETSPGKYQVVWKAQGFTKEEAERLMRTMASNYGTDKAATDVSRVLRIPGFQNKKYAEPFRVKAERFTGDVYTPEHFRVERKQEEGKGRDWGDSKKIKSPASKVVDRGAEKEKVKDFVNRSLTQSELDWHRVIEQVLKRTNLKDIAKGLVKDRQDKPNPEYYAALTTAKGYAKISADRGTDPEKVKGVIEKELKDFVPDIKNISENAISQYYGNRGAERGR